MKHKIAENRIMRFFKFRTISSKLILSLVIGGILIIIGTEITLSTALTTLEQKLISEREKTDMNYIEDIIGEGEWHIKNGVLYKGDVMLGDGTEETAFKEPFEVHEKRTGTFSYVFMKTSDEGLTWVGDKKTGYQQGHYIRIAGSTKNPDGSSIVGTYMDVKVADELDRTGTMTGAANVHGSYYFCLYKTLKNNNGEVVGAMVCGRNVDELWKQEAEFMWRALVIIMIIIMAVIVGLVLIAKNWTNSIRKIMNHMKQIQFGAFPEVPIQIKTKDEFSDICNSLNAMTESLVEKERMGSELSVATAIQANMLPSTFPAFPNRKDFDIFATMSPAKEVGGDFYDFFMINDHTIGFGIGDVSGKGVPAALFMVISKTLIKNYALLGLSPEEIFTRTNSTLCEGNKANLFVTSWYGIMDTETGILKYANAGHNPPLVKKADGQFEYLKNRTGFVLAGIDTIHYKQGEIQLEPGDRILIYTDGVTEATNVNNELYGEERLLHIMNENIDLSATKMIKTIREDIDVFVGDAPQFDDITMLMFDYKKKEEKKNWTEKTFVALRENLGDVIAFVEEELEKYECPMKTVMQISVCLEEIFINIASYAYGNQIGDAYVGVGFEEETREVTVCTMDRGMPFNPLEREDPDTTLSAEDRKIGGLGIFMVKKMMDKVEYESIDGQNKLTIVKKI